MSLNLTQQQEDGENLLKKVVKNFLPTSNASPIVQIRHRPSIVHTNTHDARGDAISLALEYMLNRKFPLWAAYILAVNLVDMYADKLNTNKVPFTDDYNSIDGNCWCQMVKDCLENYINDISEGVHNLPIMPKEWIQFPFSLSSQKNRKPNMEDKHIVLPTFAVVELGNINEEIQKDAFFAVFDGHRGAECANYASAHFVECIFEALSQTKDIEKVLEDAFDRIDKRITTRCRKENIKSGTTASCVYLQDKMAYMAWCGDSSIGILQSNAVYTLSTPHKPEDPDERKRIEDAGGIVVNVHGVPRLNGVLNLSRSLGDIRGKPMVSPKPSIETYELSEHDYILFLASDGVWENLEELEIYSAVRSFVTDNHIQDYSLLSEFISNKAKEAGASDNLTLISVFLKPLEEIWKEFTQT